MSLAGAFYHTFDSNSRQAKGFPDLCLVRGKRLIFAELKTDTGKLTADQEAWLIALGAVPGLEVACCERPKSWPDDREGASESKKPLTRAYQNKRQRF